MDIIALKSVSENEFSVCSVKSSDPFEILSSHKKGSGADSQYNQRVLAIAQEREKELPGNGKLLYNSSNTDGKKKEPKLVAKRTLSNVDIPVEASQETLEAAECLLSIGLVSQGNYVYDSTHRTEQLHPALKKSRVEININEGIVLPRKVAI